MPQGYKAEIIQIPWNGERIEGKECTECQRVLPLECFKKNPKGNGGRESKCRDCRKILRKLPPRPKPAKKTPEETLERKRRNSIRYYQENTEEILQKKAKRRQDPEKRALDAKTRQEWDRNNKDKKKASKHNRRARLLCLTNTITGAQLKSIREYSGNACFLTGRTDGKLHIEHFIPTHWGHGGSYLGNLFFIHKAPNISKLDRNPFEWFKKYGANHGITQERWDELVAWLAEQNGLSVKDFAEFVYWCEAHKRTVEELRADQRPSIEIWREQVLAAT